MTTTATTTIVAAAPRTRSRANLTVSRTLRRVLFDAAVALIVLWSLTPFLWQLNASFQPDRNLSAAVPTWLPFPGGTLDHYRSVFGERHFQGYIVNSVIVAGTATLVGLFIAMAGSYALARLPLPGKAVVLGLILGISMFPQIALVAPLYLILRPLHLLNTYEGLGFSYTGLSLPLMVFIMYAFFRGIPREMEEAAAIDGASTIRTIWSIVIP